MPYTAAYARRALAALYQVARKSDQPYGMIVELDILHKFIDSHDTAAAELAADVAEFNSDYAGFTVETDDCLIGYAAQLAADGLEQITSNSSKLPCGIYAIVEPCGAVFSFVRHDNTGQFYAVSNAALAVMQRAE